MALTITFSSFKTATAVTTIPINPPSGGINNNQYIGVVCTFTTTTGLVPISVITGDGFIFSEVSTTSGGGGGLDYGYIEFYVNRQSINRVAKFNNTALQEFNLSIARVQFIANSSYYSNYTFTNAGVITITPNFQNPAQNYSKSVTPQYRLKSILGGNVIGIPNAYTYIPTFNDVPLGNCNLQIIDEYGGDYTMQLVYSVFDTLTIIKDFNTLQLTNNPMVIIADSELKSSGNMKYKFTLMDGDDNILHTTNIYPDYTNSLYGKYNMNMIYNSYTITTPTFKNINKVITDNVFKFKYNIIDDLTTTGITSNNKYCFKGASSYANKINIDDYIGVSTIQKLLTSWVGDYLLRNDDYATINYANGKFNDDIIPQTKDFSHIAFIKNDGVIDWEDENQVTYLPINPGDDNLIINLPFGMKNYALMIASNSIVNHAGDVINTNFMYDDDTILYRFCVVDRYYDEINPVSEIITININKDELCLKYEPTHFIWMDNLGNYNTFTFNGINTKEYNIDRNEVNSDYYSIIGNDWTYNYGDRGRKNINIKKTEIHQANSGWLDNNLSTNLIELYSSSDVYVIINDELFPIIVTSNNVVEKNINNDRLFNHTINYIMAYDINVNE